MPKVSVIVPIWNVEKYLPKCLDSLVNQTLKDIEIICINDGSPDNCLNILKEYQAKDDRIVIIDQKNGGLANARNSGLKIAKGEYIMFCDSDDYYDITMCEKMFNAIVENDCDTVICKVNSLYFANFDKKEDDENWYCKFKFSGKQNISDYVIMYTIQSSVVKIYKKSIIDKYNIRFPDKLFYEDNAFYYNYMVYAKSIFYLDERLYNRVRHEGSIMNRTISGKISKPNDYIKNVKYIFDFYEKNHLLEEKYNLLLRIFFYFFNISCKKIKIYNLVELLNISNELLKKIKIDQKNVSIREAKIIELILKKKYFSLYKYLRNSPEYQTKYNIKLLDLISLFKIKEYSDKNKSIKKKFYILSIPFIKTIKKAKKTYIKLFCFIPLLKINSNIKNKKLELSIQNNYQLVLERIKNKISKNKKIRIGFLVNQKAKWVYQDLYDKLKNNEYFEILVLVTNIYSEKIENTYNFFKDQNMIVELVYNNHIPIDLNKFDIDILFYQQHWDLNNKYKIDNVSKFALTCHVHYGICQSFDAIRRGEDFYKNLFANFVIDDKSKSNYIKYFSKNLDNVIVTGHPKLDVYYKYKGNTEVKYVIYAPHHSFKGNNPHCATFDKNGLEILEFAKNHPKFSWIFKPHPRFKYAVVQDGIIKKDEIEDYYNEWAKIGVIHTDGNYFDIFKQARCMITDSISFLTEFFPTRQPVIHLRSKNAEEYDIMSKQIIDHYYAVYNNKELQKYLNMVLIEDKDPKKNERIEVLENLKLCESNASDNIINYLKKVIGI